MMYHTALYGFGRKGHAAVGRPFLSFLTRVSFLCTYLESGFVFIGRASCSQSDLERMRDKYDLQEMPNKSTERNKNSGMSIR